MASTTERQRRELYYSGRVQGVGFRFTVHAIAKRFAVVGYVRNLSDGRVHLLVEGEKDEVRTFLAAVQDHLQRYIANVEDLSGPASGRYTAFEVRI